MNIYDCYDQTRIFLFAFFLLIIQNFFLIDLLTLYCSHTHTHRLLLCSIFLVPNDNNNNDDDDNG